MGLLDLLGGGVVNGIVGAAGGVISTILQGRQKRAEMEHEARVLPMKLGHELELRRADLEAMKAEAEAKIQVVREEGEAAAAVKQLDLVAASYQHDAALHASGSWLMRNLIDPFAASVRPGVTLWAACLVAYITWLLMPALRASVLTSPVEARALLDRVLGMAEMVFAWWFAARLTSQRGKR